MIKFVIEGIGSLIEEGKRISDLKKKIPAEVMRICNSTGNKMVRSSKIEYIIRGSKGKRKYLAVNPTKLTSRTGNLRSSINFQTEQSGDSTEFKFGTWVKYGKIHELGGTISMPARTATLFFGKKGFAKEKKAKYGMKVNIGSYTVNMPERPFLRPSFEKHLPDFRDKLYSMFARLY